MVEVLIVLVLKYLNTLHSEGSISRTMGPESMLEYKPNLEIKKKNVSLGSYEHAQIGTTSTTKRRSISAMALNKANEYDGHYSMSVFSIKKTHLFEWEGSPIDEDIISCAIGTS